MALTPNQQRFVDHLIAGATGSDAYRAAYPRSRGTPSTVAVEANKLMNHPKIAPILAKAFEAAQERVQITAADVAEMWSEAATVDRNELTEIRRHCCRFCWGIDHQYQETPNEHRRRREDYDRLVAETPDTNWPPFKELGGVGYNRNKPINPECPECFGDGEMTVIMKDTRSLSRGARQIFEGVKVTKDGIEIRMMDRGSAIAGLAKSLGMDKSVNLNMNLNVDAKDIPADHVEAARVYARLMGG